MTGWGDLPGSRLIGLDVAGTALFTVTAAVAAVAGGWSLWPAFVVQLALFVAGLALFVAAYATAVARSREAEMGIGGLFFLAGRDTAPAAVRRWLLGAFAVQCVVALAAAAARPFSGLAFAVLAPLFGVGVQGLWAARHGQFAPRVRTPSRSRNSRSHEEMGKNVRHG